jgi:hypothetical protein
MKTWKWTGLMLSAGLLLQIGSCALQAAQIFFLEFVPQTLSSILSNLTGMTLTT